MLATETGQYRALKKGDVTTSAVAEHVLEAGHKASVIDYCLLESWHIQHHQAPLNREGPLARTLCNSIGLTSALSNHF